MPIRSDIIVSAVGAAALSLTVYGALGGAAPANALHAQAVQPPPAFAQCRGCHTVVRGGRSGVGPNLFGVSGAPAAAKPDYAYSSAMRASRLRWDRATLDAYLADPRAVVPGTRMTIPVRNAAQRREIIDYLARLN